MRRRASAVGGGGAPVWAPRRFGKKLQFVEIFVGLPLVLRLGDESDQDGGFGTSFGVDEFFHVKMSVLLL